MEAEVKDRRRGTGRYSIGDDEDAERGHKPKNVGSL